MIAIVLPIALALMTIALLLNLYRLLKGPSLPDRIVALDTMYINVLALLVLLGVWRGSMLYFEAGLVIAMLGFVGTIALAKFIIRDRILE